GPVLAVQPPETLGEDDPWEGLLIYTPDNNDKVLVTGSLHLVGDKESLGVVWYSGQLWIGLNLETVMDQFGLA
ncbi:hypothetical protein Prudu_019140, partial [Prunus dulcis]